MQLDKNSNPENETSDVWQSISQLDEKIDILGEFTFNYVEKNDSLHISGQDLETMRFKILLDVLQKQGKFIDAQVKYIRSQSKSLSHMRLLIHELLTYQHISGAIKRFIGLSLFVFLLTMTIRAWLNYDFILTPAENQLEFNGCISSVCFEVKHKKRGI